MRLRIVGIGAMVVIMALPLGCERHRDRHEAVRVEEPHRHERVKAEKMDRDDRDDHHRRHEGDRD